MPRGKSIEVSRIDNNVSRPALPELKFEICPSDKAARRVPDGLAEIAGKLIFPGHNYGIITRGKTVLYANGERVRAVRSLAGSAFSSNFIRRVL